MTCPSCGYPEPHRLGDWCPYCVAYPEVRGDGSRPWAELDQPMPFEQEEIDAHNQERNDVSGETGIKGLFGTEMLAERVEAEAESFVLALANLHDGYCQGMTKRGALCGNLPLKGTKYCHVHTRSS